MEDHSPLRFVEDPTQRLLVNLDGYEKGPLECLFAVAVFFPFIGFCLLNVFIFMAGSYQQCLAKLPGACPPKLYPANFTEGGVLYNCVEQPTCAAVMTETTAAYDLTVGLIALPAMMLLLSIVDTAFGCYVYQCIGRAILRRKLGEELRRPEMPSISPTAICIDRMRMAPRHPNYGQPPHSLRCILLSRAMITSMLGALFMQLGGAISWSFFNDNREVSIAAVIPGAVVMFVIMPYFLFSPLRQALSNCRARRVAEPGSSDEPVAYAPVSG